MPRRWLAMIWDSSRILLTFGSSWTSRCCEKTRCTVSSTWEKRTYLFEFVCVLSWFHIYFLLSVWENVSRCLVCPGNCAVSMESGDHDLSRILQPQHSSFCRGLNSRGFPSCFPKATAKGSCQRRDPNWCCHQRLPNLDCHRRLPNLDCLVESRWEQSSKVVFSDILFEKSSKWSSQTFFLRNLLNGLF